MRLRPVERAEHDYVRARENSEGWLHGFVGC